MKHSIRICALALALCLLFPLLIGCGAGTGPASSSETASATEKPTESQTATDTESEPPEEETDEEDVIPAGSVCYVGVDENDMDRFYSTIEDAISDNPDGCKIFMLEDYEMTVALPENYPIQVYFLYCDVELDFTGGVICEFCRSTRGVFDRLYLSDYRMLLADDEMRPFEDPSGVIVWFFEETDGMQSGRYNLLNINAADKNLDPEYEYRYVCDLSFFNVPYVCEADGLYYYRVQDAINNVTRKALEKPHIVGPSIADALITVPIPGNEYLQVPYMWFPFFGAFHHGVTYDDNVENHHGFLYYNDLLKFVASPSIVGCYAYIWSDLEGFAPGLYVVASKSTGEEDVVDEDELVIEGDLGIYRLLRVADIAYMEEVVTLAQYGHLEEDGLYLVLDRDFYDLRAGKYMVTELDNKIYGTKEYDADGNVIATDLTCYRIVWVEE